MSKLATTEITRIEPDVAVLTLYGEHDFETRDELAAQLELLVNEAPHVIVDLSQVEYIVSATLSVLVHADTLAREHGEMVTLRVEPGTNVARVIEITRMRDLLPIADSLDEAIRIAMSTS
jgi:anti-anti-sigma factor